MKDKQRPTTERVREESKNASQNGFTTGPQQQQSPATNQNQANSNTYNFEVDREYHCWINKIRISIYWAQLIAISQDLIQTLLLLIKPKHQVILIIY